jgi:hypothetical protein
MYARIGALSSTARWKPGQLSALVAEEVGLPGRGLGCRLLAPAPALVPGFERWGGNFGALALPLGTASVRLDLSVS